MKKRYKLLLIIFISFLIVIIIYFIFSNKQKYVFSIKETNVNYAYDDFYKNDYILKRYENDNIILDDLLKKIKDDNMAKYMKKSNIIIINFGTSELNNYYKLNENIIINYLSNAYLILNSIRDANKRKIYFINFYDEKYSFINKKLMEYCNNLDIVYVNSKFLKDYLYTINNKSYLLYNGEKKLYTYLINH